MRNIKLSHLAILAVMIAAMFLMPVNTSVSQASEPAKVYLKHYNLFGTWSGRLHQIDEETKWELTKAILDKGGLPTERNIDCLLHYPDPCP